MQPVQRLHHTGLRLEVALIVQHEEGLFAGGGPTLDERLHGCDLYYGKRFRGLVRSLGEAHFPRVETCILH